MSGTRPIPQNTPSILADQLGGLPISWGFSDVQCFTWGQEHVLYFTQLDGKATKSPKTLPIHLLSLNGSSSTPTQQVILKHIETAKR